MTKMSCQDCGHHWESRVKVPIRCPNCKRCIGFRTENGVVPIVAKTNGVAL